MMGHHGTLFLGVSVGCFQTEISIATGETALPKARGHPSVRGRLKENQKVGVG